MSRSVNLNNVNISIAEFQKLSSGTYNAGEVKLASESKLTKINNHVSSFWRSANKVAVSHEEVLAIKNAFVRAFEGGGVGKDEINRVRAQLGLRPDGSADKTLANNAIVDKIESLCGKCHPNQLSSICFTLSQSGAGSIVNNAFIQQGIRNDEHMALTFSLAKNDETGAVVVTVSEPPGFPVRFHWTAAVALDGTVTTTPMEIEKVPIQENLRNLV